MSALKLIAIVLILAGVAGLVMGSFTYARTTHQMTVGPFHASMHENRTVNIPLWAGIAAIVAGVVILVVPRRT